MSPLAVLGFFALIFLTPHNAGAAESPITPAAMQGVWSSPDCADSKKTWIISAHYFIHADRQGVVIDRMTGWRKDDNNGDTLYAFDAASSESALINRTNDGLMKVIRGDVKKDAALNTLWGWTQEEVAEEYSRCVKLFDTTPHMGQSEVNSIFLLDQAMETCRNVTAEKLSGAGGAACRKNLFDLADGNGDHKLDRTELALLERQLAFLNRGLQAQPQSCAAPVQTLSEFLLPPDRNSIDLKGVLDAAATQPDLWRKAGALAQLLPFLPSAENCTPEAPIKTGIKAEGAVLPAPLNDTIPVQNIPGAKIRP